MKAKKLPAWTKKLPKSVTICGKRWKIKCNMRGGCMFNYLKSLITVGCNCGSDTAIEGLIHEISEAVHIEMRYRYARASGGENGDMLFCMNHNQFEIHNLCLVAALRDCGLLKC